jgi:hypothetical protein
MIRPVLLAAALLAGAATPAAAQDPRVVDREVARGASMQFQWLNFDEIDCRDRGHARIVVTRPPRLGTFRITRSRVRADSGTCAGRPLSVVFVTYRAGRNPGTDDIRYAVIGAARIEVVLRMTVR